MKLLVQVCQLHSLMDSGDRRKRIETRHPNIQPTLHNMQFQPCQPPIRTRFFFSNHHTYQDVWHVWHVSIILHPNNAMGIPLAPSLVCIYLYHKRMMSLNAVKLLPLAIMKSSKKLQGYCFQLSIHRYESTHLQKYMGPMQQGLSLTLQINLVQCVILVINCSQMCYRELICTVFVSSLYHMHMYLSAPYTIQEHIRKLTHRVAYFTYIK